MTTHTEAVEEAKLPKTTRGRGRPKGSRNPPPKPLSNKKAMEKFRERILNSPKASSVLTSIFDAALDKDDPHRAVAWKLLIDRFAPLRDFEGGQVSGRSSVNITITGVNTEADDNSNVIEVN